MEKRVWAIIILLGFSLSVGRAEDAIVERIDGDKIVVVKGPQGNRVVEKGGRVMEGESIKTGARASARLKFKDGSRLLVGRGSELLIEKPKGGTQWTELKSGEVRGIIKPRPDTPGQPSPQDIEDVSPSGAPAVPEGSKLQAQKPKPPKFGVRTRSAVMGVRGTDFVFGAKDTGSQLKTLEGTVEIAKDEPTLIEGKGTLVKRDQMVESQGGQIGEVKGFDSQAYLKEMMAKQPYFVRLTRGLEGEVSYAKAPEIVEKRPAWIRLLEFRVFGLYAKQFRGKGDSASAGLSWNPVIELLGPFALRGHLAGFPLKDSATKSSFMAMQIGIFGCFTLLRPLILEAGAGGEEWFSGQGGMGTLVMGQVGWQLSEFDLLERIFVSAQVYDRPVPPTAGQTWSGKRIDTVGHVTMGVGLHF